MPSAVLYFVAQAAQMLASIGVLAINIWMIKTLKDLGFQITENGSFAWASFYCLMAIALLSIIVPFIQGLLMGCLCCGGCIRRPLSRGHYTAQAIFLGLQAVGWIAAAGWGLTVIIVNETVQYFGNIQWLAVACSWIAPVLAIIMIIIVTRLRAARVKADMEAHNHHHVKYES